MKLWDSNINNEDYLIQIILTLYNAFNTSMANGVVNKIEIVNYQLFINKIGKKLPDI